MSEYRVQFEVFEGPLDLLLHLVKKQEVDIYQVNLLRIATEFVTYIEQMRELDLEIAGEFVVMAATLLYIKSRELLPVDKQVAVAVEDEDTEDPRWELIRRLVEYKKFKDAAQFLGTQEAKADEFFATNPELPDLEAPVAPSIGQVGIFDLIRAFQRVLKRFENTTDIREIVSDRYTVADKIEHLLEAIPVGGRVRFESLFSDAASRVEVIVTFLAMLELMKLNHLQVEQEQMLGEIIVLRPVI